MVRSKDFYVDKVNGCWFWIGRTKNKYSGAVKIDKRRDDQLCSRHSQCCHPLHRGIGPKLVVSGV